MVNATRNRKKLRECRNDLWRDSPEDSALEEVPMSEDHPPISGSLPPSLEKRVDNACDRFEEAWRAEAHPRIEDFLSGFSVPEHPVLLRQLLALEIELRVRFGDLPIPEDYKSRFIGHEELV